MLIAMLLLATTAAADDVGDALERMRERGTLRWGADAHGGAPYVFQDANDPTHLVGFEVDLAEAVAQQLGVRAALMQGPWDKLLDLVDSDAFDVVLNGIEESDDKRQSHLLSRPYYVAAQRVTHARDTASWQQLSDAKGKTVGCLTGTLACRLLAEQGATVRAFDVQDDIYQDIKVGRSDAALADEPIAHYYGDIDEALVTDATPFGELRYVAAFRKADTTLKLAVDEALERLAKDGTLRAIYEKWGLWNAPTAALLDDDDASAQAVATGYEKWRLAVGSPPSFFERVRTRYPAMMPLFFRGAVITMLVSVLSMMLAVVLGVLLAIGRAFGGTPLRFASIAYVELFRGTPLLVQLTIVYFGLPELGIVLSPFTAGVVALGLNYAATESENYRAGLLAVPSSQLEAARALGLTTIQALRHIIFPQALRVALPPMTNDFIALLKDSSLVSMVALTELTKTYGVLGNSTRDHLGLGAVVALWYLVIGLPFVWLSRRLEHQLARR